MHRQRKIAMDQINLIGVDVVVHQLLISGLKELLAGRALKIAEHFHGNRRILRTERLVWIDVREAENLCWNRSQGWNWRGSFGGRRGRYCFLAGACQIGNGSRTLMIRG